MRLQRSPSPYRENRLMRHWCFCLALKPIRDNLFHAEVSRKLPLTSWSNGGQSPRGARLHGASPRSTLGQGWEHPRGGRSLQGAGDSCDEHVYRY